MKRCAVKDVDFIYQFYKIWCFYFHKCSEEVAGGEEAVRCVVTGVLLAVGVVYHAVDMDLFAHVHGQDEREPAGAQVRAGLNPANAEKNK